MNNHEFGALLKESLKNATPPTDVAHFEKTQAACADALVYRASRQRIGFGRFLLLQVRFIGWRIWLIQGAILRLHACQSLASRYEPFNPWRTHESHLRPFPFDRNNCMAPLLSFFLLSHARNRSRYTLFLRQAFCCKRLHHYGWKYCFTSR